jgi:hypothetical protein
MARHHDDPEEELCGSHRTVQMGELSAVDLRCMLRRWQHDEPLHFTTRSFGDVDMHARWVGEFEPSGEWPK